MEEKPITEADIIPADFIQRATSIDHRWPEQFARFTMEERNASAQRLYSVLSPEQRTQLKRYGKVTFICAKGHPVTVTPYYGNTSTAGCISIRQPEKSAHAATCIGDFLLTIKLRFAEVCSCRSW